MARRSQQYCGRTGDAQDVIAEDLSLFHIECKRTEALRLYEALNQAENERKPGKISLVAHRPNNKEWVFIFEGKAFLALLRELGDCLPKRLEYGPEKKIKGTKEREAEISSGVGG